MCQMTMEELNREDLIGIIRNAPTRSEYNAVCLALRQQTRRNKRALELLSDMASGKLGGMSIDEIEHLVNEAHAILKE